MKCIVVSALAVAVTLAGWTPGSAGAEEEYVKVEIRGILRLYKPPAPSWDRVVLRREEFHLDLTRVTGKSISEKQLKELDNEFVIVKGRLVLHRDPGLRVVVEVTKISLAPVKKDK